jgi:hypothetical protein
VTLVSEEFLVSRRVAQLFPESLDVGYASVDTAREFRVMSDRGHETGVFLDSAGVYQFAEWFPGKEPSVTWWTNSTHAMEVALTLMARRVGLTRGRITWRHPLPPGETFPGYEVDRAGAILSVSWDSGQQWMKTIGIDFPHSEVAAMALWVPYSVDEIVESIDNPPGPVGLVPYRRFDRISVQEALRDS